jgi:hypothetical protein
MPKNTGANLRFNALGLVLIILTWSTLSLQPLLLLLIPVVGYGFAWVGHFFFEKNKPATFQYPFYSLASDFLLFFDLLRGKEKFNSPK